jgi:hypothetical protein
MPLFVAGIGLRGNDAANTCATPELRATKNADGDFFFCAGAGAEMGPIFVSAVNAISSNSRFGANPRS